MMMFKLHRMFLVLLWVVPLVTLAENVDLRQYYEEQKAELLKEFNAPEDGSEISLKLTTGNIRTGTLALLTPDTVTIQMKVGPVTYSRMMLDSFTRTQLFAADYAEYNAIARTRALKNKQEGNPRQIGEARLHAARVSIKDSIEKSNNKDETVDTKGSTEITTETKTKTETCTLEITVANMSANEDTFALEWYFVKTPITDDGDGDPEPGDKGSTEITIPGNKKAEHTATSLDFTFTELSVERENPNATSDSSGPTVTKSGDEYKGYVVFVKHGDEILDKKSSTKTFLTDEWLEKLKGSVAAPTPLSRGKKGKKKNK
ncbi:MAG: hypothetical protein K9M45_03660 [Kiritimatiellales bacterium]|nr:hypothetical protein [Kiritimatiellales bacterium]